MNFSVNSSATFFTTKNLFDAIQLCPQLMNLPLTAPSAALSMLASSNTMKGSLPPNSSTHFFKLAEARSATLAPALVLPVKVTALTPDSIKWFAESTLPTTV